MIHKACMPVYMNSGKIVADGTGGTGGKIEGSTRGPRGPKNTLLIDMSPKLPYLTIRSSSNLLVLNCVFVFVFVCVFVLISNFVFAFVLISVFIFHFVTLN